MNLSLKPGPDEERCKRDLFDVLEIDPGTHPNKIVTDNGRKVQGTCEWVTESEKYLGWINSPSGLLWISGGPGKGKTFISVHTYQKLVEFPGTTTICFFCDNKSVTRNSATKVLCGLIYQLVDKHPDLFPIMVPKWKTQDKLLFEEASFETQWRILESMLRSIKRQVYCVLDGLDECDEDSLRRLLFKIETIFQSNQQNDHSLKFVVLSRRHPSILEETLGAHPHLKLDPDSDTEVRHDVKLFISSRVKELATRRKIDNQLLISHIERVLQQKCENTFLWVSFMTKDLMSKSIPNIEEALEDLPTGIDEVYTRILLQIKPEDKAAISKLLLWIAFARRPLDLGTLAAAADIQDTKTLTKTEVCRGHVISCGHLLQWGRRGNHDLDESTKVTFVHQSAKDFMLCPTKDSVISGFKMAVGEGHMKIADLIVGYMEKNKRESKTYTRGEYSFKNYVIQYWPKYLSMLTEAQLTEVMGQHVPFFEDGSIISIGWVSGGVWNQPPPTGLHCACFKGLLGWVEVILAEQRRRVGRRPWSASSFKKYINSRDEHGWTPLHLACMANAIDIVKALITAGVDPTLTDNRGDTPLHNVHVIKETEIFNFLCSNKAAKKILQKESRAKNLGHSSVLHIAANDNNTNACDLLINKLNYNTSIKDNKGCTPLGWAFAAQSFDAALFLTAAAEARKTGSNRGSVQLPTNLSDMKEVDRLDLLVQRSQIDINTQGDSSRTILHTAAQRFNTELVAHCLSLGADPSLKDDYGNTPLGCLGSYWSEKSLRIVLTLLFRGQVNINSSCCHCEEDTDGSLLCEASSNAYFYEYEKPQDQYKHYIQSLLDLGPDRSSSVALVRSRIQKLANPKKSSCEPTSLWGEGEKEKALKIWLELLDLLENYTTVVMLPQMMDPAQINGWDWTGSVEDTK